MDAEERAYRKAAKSLPVVRRGRNVERFTDSEGKRRRFYKTPQGEDQMAISRKSKMAAAARIRDRASERQAAEPPLTEAQELTREKRRGEARKDRAALKAERMEDARPGETYEKMRKRQAIKRHDAFRDARDKRREERADARLGRKRERLAKEAGRIGVGDEIPSERQKGISTEDFWPEKQTNKGGQIKKYSYRRGGLTTLRKPKREK